MSPETAGILWLSGAILIGLVNCYFGYRLFIVTVGIVGFLIGASLGFLLGNWVGNLGVMLIAAAILGFIGGWLSISAYYAFIFVFGAVGFALLAAFISGLYSNSISIVMAIVAGLIGGFLAYWLQRVIIIFATAAQGALSIVLAIASLISSGGPAAYRHMLYRLLEGDIPRTGGIWFYSGLLLWLALFVSGMIIQFKRGKEMYRERPRGAPRGIE